MDAKTARRTASVMLQAHGSHAKLFVRMQISRCEADRVRASAAAAWKDVLRAMDDIENLFKETG